MGFVLSSWSTPKTDLNRLLDVMQTSKLFLKLCSLVLLVVSAPVYGALESPASDYWSLSYLVKTIVALLFVLGFFIIAARIMQRFQIRGTPGNGELEILAGLSLGSKEKIVVVRAGNEQLVLGVTANQINTLLVLNSPLKEDEKSTGVFRSKLDSVVATRRKAPS